MAVYLWVTLFFTAINSLSFGHHKRHLLCITCVCVTFCPSTSGDSDECKHKWTPRSEWYEKVLFGFKVDHWDCCSLRCSQFLRQQESAWNTWKSGKLIFAKFLQLASSLLSLWVFKIMLMLPKLLFDWRQKAFHLPFGHKVFEDKYFVIQAGWRNKIFW